MRVSPVGLDVDFVVDDLCSTIEQTQRVNGCAGFQAKLRAEEVQLDELVADLQIADQNADRQNVVRSVLEGVNLCIVKGDALG